MQLNSRKLANNSSAAWVSASCDVSLLLRFDLRSYSRHENVSRSQKLDLTAAPVYCVISLFTFIQRRLWLMNQGHHGVSLIVCLVDCWHIFMTAILFTLLNNSNGAFSIVGILGGLTELFQTMSDERLPRLIQRTYNLSMLEGSRICLPGVYSYCFVNL